MTSFKESKWHHVLTARDGDAQLFGVNLFSYKWVDIGESAVVTDPVYGQERRFSVYEVEINGIRHKLAAGEFSNCIWGFAFP